MATSNHVHNLSLTDCRVEFRKIRRQEKMGTITAKDAFTNKALILYWRRYAIGGDISKGAKMNRHLDLFRKYNLI